MLVVGATGGKAGPAEDCDQVADPDLQIRGCSRFLELVKGNKEGQAIVYTIRGSAYANKGKSDRAIADYTKAIQINPQYANAYNNRGNVYREKGQHARAIADLRRSHVLGNSRATRSLKELGVKP